MKSSYILPFYWSSFLLLIAMASNLQFHVFHRLKRCTVLDLTQRAPLLYSLCEAFVQISPRQPLTSLVGLRPEAAPNPGSGRSSDPPRSPRPLRPQGNILREAESGRFGSIRAMGWTRVTEADR